MNVFMGMSNIFWTFINKPNRMESVPRAWYNGSTPASQAEDEGSIPFARTKKNKADHFWSALFLLIDSTRWIEPKLSILKEFQRYRLLDLLL